MIPDEILYPLLTIVNGPKAGELSLSKGGWEGWLQCELWAALNSNKIANEREVSFPGTRKRCDLVVKQILWIELKAYGIFREGDANEFLDAVAADVDKLINERPKRTLGLLIVVVPNAIAESFSQAINERKWKGFTQKSYTYVTIYDMNFE
jgi:hypothetical protein